MRPAVRQREGGAKLRGKGDLGCRRKLSLSVEAAQLAVAFVALGGPGGLVVRCGFYLDWDARRSG